MGGGPVPLRAGSSHPWSCYLVTSSFWHWFTSAHLVHLPTPWWHKIRTAFLVLHCSLSLKRASWFCSCLCWTCCFSWKPLHGIMPLRLHLALCLYLFIYLQSEKFICEGTRWAGKGERRGKHLRRAAGQRDASQKRERDIHLVLYKLRCSNAPSPKVKPFWCILSIITKVHYNLDNFSELWLIDKTVTLF